MPPINGYFDIPFAVAGDVATVPDATQLDGSVSYQQGFPILYSTPTGSGGFNFPRNKNNQILNDITTAVQKLQQGSPPAFITSTMNGGSPYSYPKDATVSLSGVSYISLQNSNTDTPPTSKWAIAFGAQSGTFTAGHLAVFADTAGTIEDGGAIPAGYSLPTATASTLGGVIVDNSTIAVSGGGTISIKSNAGLPGSPTTTTQASGDNSTKIATTAYADAARIMTPLGIGSIIQACYTVSGSLSAGASTAAANLTAMFTRSNNAAGFPLCPVASGDSLTGTWQALQSVTGTGQALASNLAIYGFFQRIS